MEDLETERHKAEVRQVLRWRVEDRNKALEYLSLAKKKRNTEKLEVDCREQWSRGNRGEIGEWYE